MAIDIGRCCGDSQLFARASSILQAVSMTKPSAAAGPSRRVLRDLRARRRGRVYTFRFIPVNANPMGDGLEWMAVFPLGFVFFELVVPALLHGAIGRLLRFGALLASAGLALNIVCLPPDRT
jgi:hypothetical protein